MNIRFEQTNETNALANCVQSLSKRIPREGTGGTNDPSPTLPIFKGKNGEGATRWRQVVKVQLGLIIGQVFYKIKGFSDDQARDSVAVLHLAFLRIFRHCSNLARIESLPG